MDQFLGFGRRCWFVCRVFFGIEERSLRARNVALHKKLMELYSTIEDGSNILQTGGNFTMREQRAMLDRVPEQMILSEVRKVVEGMQRLNNTLTKTEKDVEKYFESLRKDANAVMDAQLEAEEATMREMIQMQSSYQNMLREKSAMNKEDIIREMAHSVSASIPQENIAQKKGDKASRDQADSVSHNVETTPESKAKKPQDPGT